MFYKILISLIIAAAVLILLWLARGILLTPVKLGRNQHLSMVLTVSGKSPELENTIDALRWLRDNGTLQGDIIVRDAGMDEETAEAAQLLQRTGAIEIIC